jgi:hypothetical protein
MRATISILLVLTLAGAYALGRWRAGDVAGTSELASIASFRSAFEQGDALERSYRFHGFLQSMGPGEVGEAAELLDSWSPWLVTDELRNFMIAWTAFDPAAALNWGLGRSGAFRAQAAGAALNGWAVHDPVAARSAMEALDPATAPAGLEEHLVAGWLSSGRHTGILEYIESKPAGLERQRYTNLLTIELMRDSPEAVIRWAEAVAEDAPHSYKSTAFQKAVNILATADPIQAAEWVEKHLDAEYAAGAPSTVAQRWLEIDPPATLDWLSTLPRGEHDKALKTALLAWLNRNDEAAEIWVRKSSPAPGLDVLVEVMVTRSSHDPQGSIEWAQRLHDPAARAEAVLRLARKWKRREREAALLWVEQSELAPKMKRAILGPSSKKPELHPHPQPQS